MTEPTELSADAWQARYDAQQMGWDRGEPSPQLIAWLHSGLLSAGHVVVPGCGLGHEVVLLAARGFEVTAIDFAEAPVSALRQRLSDLGLQASLLQEDVLSVHLAKPADFVFEQTCLCAISPGDRVRYERQIYGWLKPKGQLLMLLMQTSNPSSGPPFHCDLAAIQSLFAPPRWSWNAAEPTAVPHPTGLHELAVTLTRI